MENYFDEPEEYEYEQEQEQEFVMGYREAQERGRGGADIMESQIEGQGSLARQQERLGQKTGSAAERKLLGFYHELSKIYARFAPNDEVLMFDEFRGLPNPTYKNPYAFLLAYIGVREGPLTKPLLAKLYGYAKDTGVSNISEEDIIRYYRLLQRVKS